MLFAEPGNFDGFVESSTGPLWKEAFENPHWLKTADLDGIEPFGFADGISQPQIDWQQHREISHAEMDFSNIVALGEFVLGYRNEYGKITDRPLLSHDAASAHLLGAVDSPEKKDLARNGTYLVIRQLEQDVRTFWQFINQESGGNAVDAEKLAAAMVGRARNGDPLVSLAEKAIPGIKGDEVRQNQFTF